MRSRDASLRTQRWGPFGVCGELACILTFGFFWRGEFAGVSARRLAIHNFQKALTDRTALAQRQAVTPPSRIVTPRQAACTLELCYPPTWSSTLPTLPSARAHVWTTPDMAIEEYRALTQAQRSTGPMQRRGSSTATGTGCDRYVYLGEACGGRESLEEPARRVCAVEVEVEVEVGCKRQDAHRATYSSTAEADQT